MPPDASFDPTLFATLAALVSFWIADVTLYYTIPKSKHRVAIFLIFNAVIWIIINISIYLATKPQSAAVTAILLANLILVFFLIIFSSIYLYLNQYRQNDRFPYFRPGIEPKLRFGLEHIDNVIIHHYLVKTNVSLNDKKDSMSAILRQISLTTVPTTLENLARIGLFEVRDNGRFRILATHHIDAHRIPKLERTFSHDRANPVGMVGIAVTEGKTILVPDLSDSSNPYHDKWKSTEENDLPGYKAQSILCVPVFDTSPSSNSTKCLAVISVSCSKKNLLSTKQKDEVELYADRVCTLLTHLNNRILFDPGMAHGIRAITISGEVASGKTTLVAELGGILKAAGWRVISIGDWFQEFCNQKSLPSTDINELPDDIHRQFDDYQQLMLSEEELIIIESRLSGHLSKDMSDVLSVYCDLSFGKRVRRYADKTNVSLEVAKQEVRNKDQQELERYRRLYQIEDYRDKSIYELWLDMENRPGALAMDVIQAMKRTE